MRTNKSLPKDEPTFEPPTLEEALRLLQEEAQAQGTDKLTMEEIIDEIAAYRREKKEQEKAGA